MKFSSVIALVSTFALPTFAQPLIAAQYNVTYDAFYDNPQTSLTEVACFDSLFTNGYTTFGSLPTFPNIGGMPDIIQNSSLCGTCWKLQYITPAGQNESIFVTAIDTAYTYFNVSMEAFDELTANTSIASGQVIASDSLVDLFYCGL